MLNNSDAPRLVLGEFLFWMHLALIIGLIFSSLVLPLIVILAVLIAHRIHVFIFDGCVLTEFKKRLGVIPRDLTFLQHATQRIWGQSITRRQSALLDYGLVTSALLLAIMKYFVAR